MSLDKTLGKLFWRGMRYNRRVERRVNRWGQLQLRRHWPRYTRTIQPWARLIRNGCLLALAILILVKVL